MYLMSTFDFMIYIYHVIFKTSICLVYVDTRSAFGFLLLKYFINYWITWYIEHLDPQRYIGIIKPVRFPLRNKKERDSKLS